MRFQTPVSSPTKSTSPSTSRGSTFPTLKCLPDRHRRHICEPSVSRASSDGMGVSRMNSGPASTTNFRSLIAPDTPSTSSSSPTTCGSPANVASWPCPADRSRDHLSSTAWASVTSTLSPTNSCLSGSCTMSGLACRTSTWTSPTTAARKSSATSRKSTAATGSPRLSRSAPWPPAPPSAMWGAPSASPLPRSTRSPVPSPSDHPSPRRVRPPTSRK